MKHTEYMIELSLYLTFDNDQRLITLHVHPDDVYEIEALGSLIGSNAIHGKTDCTISIDNVKRLYYEEAK